MKEIKAKNDSELKTLLSEKREEIRTARFGMAGSATRDVRAVRKNRRTIARILTEQRMRVTQN